MKFIVADTLSENGHLSFNKFILKGLITKNIVSTSFLSKEILDKLDLKNSSVGKGFPVWLVGKGNMFFYILKQFYLHIILIALAKKNSSAVLLLSYEIYSFSLMSHIYRVFGVEVFIINHNTVPKKNNSVKGWFFSKISDKVIHFCLEEYITHFVTTAYNKIARTFPHPILINEGTESDFHPNSNQKQFFMPSSTIPSNVADEIIDVFSKKKDYTLLMKNIGEKQSENVLKSTFFSNYYTLLSRSKFVILPQNFDYRVSGVFYEALAYNNLIFMTESMMSKNLKVKYPKKVILVSDFSEIIGWGESFSATNMCFDNTVDVEKYNENSIILLLRGLCE